MSQTLQALWGLLCFSMAASEQIALGYTEGGPDQENYVADSLVESLACVRIPEENPIYGYVVFYGKRIGQKQIVGMSAMETGDPELYGLIGADEGARQPN